MAGAFVSGDQLWNFVPSIRATLRTNPANPRRTLASPEADAMLAASIAAIGIIQPPLVRTDGEELVIVAGHRRVAAAIATDLERMKLA